jgi:cytochrome c-type biogenesis protein CcmH
VVDIYEFDTASQRQRYHSLSEELRCPKCQNQNLAGSDSQISEDLRRELHRLLLEGKTDREIKTYMVERYGDFVLYKPRFQKSTLVLWVLPFVLFVIGIFVLTLVVSRRKAKASEEGANIIESDVLTDQEQSKLTNVLASKESRS